MEEDSEFGKTADGLMTAISRVLTAIRGKFPDMYEKLELILEESLYLCLSPKGETSLEDALKCINELLINQK